MSQLFSDLHTIEPGRFCFSRILYSPGEKAFGFCPFGARRAVTLQIGAKVLTRSAYADNEKEENARMLKWEWGHHPLNDWWPTRPHLQSDFSHKSERSK